MRARGFNVEVNIDVHLDADGSTVTDSGLEFVLTYGFDGLPVEFRTLAGAVNDSNLRELAFLVYLDEDFGDGVRGFRW